MATLFTRVGSCALQGIDPWEYLKDVLDRIHHRPVARIAELTPNNRRRIHDPDLAPA